MRTKRPMKTFSFRMDPQTKFLLDKMAYENNLTISDQLNMILKWALKNWVQPQPEALNPTKRPVQAKEEPEPVKTPEPALIEIACEVFKTTPEKFKTMSPKLQEELCAKALKTLADNTKF